MVGHWGWFRVCKRYLAGGATSPTTNLAEIAFMVAPDWQGLGLGGALQARLQEYAIGRGVRGFVAEILPQN